MPSYVDVKSRPSAFQEYQRLLIARYPTLILLTLYDRNGRGPSNGSICPSVPGFIERFDDLRLVCSCVVIVPTRN